jgi:serine/threonine protein kinase
MKTCPVCDTPYPDLHATCPTDGAVLLESRELEPDYVVRGKYRILRKIGQGGMGVVYLAEHRMLGGQVALKFLATELSRNPQFVKRFRNEARAAYQLRHPNIVEVADLDQDEDGSLFIAMEFVEGPSLRSVLRHAKGPLPVGRALQIAKDIAAGLSAAHARGAIHRDIKPENILVGVNPDGGEQAKVLDFGIAAMTESITNLSRTHGLLLTPEYAAPEQWRGTPAGDLDGRTDLYALGGVLYEMLAGRTPFRAENPEGWMFQHLQGVPEPLELVRPDLNREFPGLGSIVTRLLARDREQRFSSAATFIDAIDQKPAALKPALAVQPISAPLTPDTRRRIRLDKRRSEKAVVNPIASAAKDRGNSWKRNWIITIVASVAVAGIVALGSWWTLSPATSAHALGEFFQKQNDYVLSTKFFAKACDVGVTTDCFHAANYAVRHHDYRQADIFYRQACNGGIMKACSILASDYETGTGVEQDDNMMRQLYQKACDGGHADSCLYLGNLYYKGDNGAYKDITLAHELYLKGCKYGDALTCYQLASTWDRKHIDSDQVNSAYRKACEGGIEDACGKGFRFTP